MLKIFKENLQLLLVDIYTTEIRETNKYLKLKPNKKLKEELEDKLNHYLFEFNYLVTGLLLIGEINFFQFINYLGFNLSKREFLAFIEANWIRSDKSIQVLSSKEKQEIEKLYKSSIKVINLNNYKKGLARLKKKESDTDVRLLVHFLEGDLNLVRLERELKTSIPSLEDFNYFIL